MAEKIVRLHMNASGVPVPDQDPVRIHRDDDKIKWVADFDFRITIDSYSDISYSSGSNLYGARTGSFYRTGTYKYSISANGVENDPIIEVGPTEAQPHRPPKPPLRPPHPPPEDDD